MAWLVGAMAWLAAAGLAAPLIGSWLAGCERLGAGRRGQPPA